MKRVTALFLTAILCLGLTACVKAPGQSPQETRTGEADTEEAEESRQQGGNTAEESEGPAQQSVELAGPWHLDGEKNDLAALAGRFPGYGEWGAGMEIRSDGQMNWYIGAEGWHGAYEVSGETLHAELASELEDRTLSWDFHITAENESAVLEMEYEDMTICWVYGEREESAAGTGSE